MVVLYIGFIAAMCVSNYQDKTYRTGKVIRGVYAGCLTNTTAKHRLGLSVKVKSNLLEGSQIGLELFALDNQSLKVASFVQVCETVTGGHLCCNERLTKHTKQEEATITAFRKKVGLAYVCFCN